MGDAYPELGPEMARIIKVIAREEEQFTSTLNAGLKMLEGMDVSSRVLKGSDIFRLYDTYGFPVDLVQDWCKERYLTCDLDGFQKELTEQKERSRASMKQHEMRLAGDLAALTDLPQTEFVGYETMESNATVLALFDPDHTQIKKLSGHGFALLDKTPFYSQSGGQVGDQGVIEFQGGVATVKDCTTPAHKRQLHHVLVDPAYAPLQEGTPVVVKVDAERRARIRAHHTATHLLHAALREVLGTHVKQAGSVVDPERLRFDFSHFAPVEPDQMAEIERRANEPVLQALATSVREMPIDEALSSGAMALFGEKYGETVRVVSVPDFSTELCGGTHVANTGQIGLIKIVSEGAVAAGVRRIEAVAGMAALERLQEDENLLGSLSRQANAGREGLSGILSAKDTRIAQLEKELKETKLKAASSGGGSENVEQVNGITLITGAVEGLEAHHLREMMDLTRTRHRSAVIALASTVAEDKVALLVSVSADLQDKADAGALLKTMAPAVEGRGGGKKDLAQGGGTKPEGIEAAFNALKAKLGM
jgi:alanyl-tRNA synthetase